MDSDNSPAVTPFPRLPWFRRLLDGAHRHLDPQGWIEAKIAAVRSLENDDLKRHVFALVRDHPLEHDIIEQTIDHLASCDLDLAIELMVLATRLHPNCPRYHFHVGMLCQETRRFDAAYHLRQACELEGRQNIAWLWHLAVAELAISDTQNAFTRAQRIAELSGQQGLTQLLELAIWKDDFDENEEPANLLTRIEVQLTAADPPESVRHDVRRLLESLRPWFEPQDIGEHLLEHGLVSSWRLRRAREAADDSDRSVVDVLLEDNVIDSADIAKVTAARYLVPEVSLDEFDIAPDVLNLVPGDVARRYGVIPVHAGANLLIVAVSEPDRDILAGLQVLTGKTIRAVVTSEQSLESEIERRYGKAPDPVRLS